MRFDFSRRETPQAPKISFPSASSSDRKVILDDDVSALKQTLLPGQLTTGVRIFLRDTSQSKVVLANGSEHDVHAIQDVMIRLELMMAREPGAFVSLTRWAFDASHVLRDENKLIAETWRLGKTVSSESFLKSDARFRLANICRGVGSVIELFPAPVPKMQRGATLRPGLKKLQFAFYNISLDVITSGVKVEKNRVTLTSPEKI